MVPPETLTVTTDGSSYIVSPSVQIGVTITDNLPSASGWAIDLSYDAGATYTNVATSMVTGATYLPNMLTLPGVTTTGDARIRVTNNTTLDVATAAPFAIVGDTITFLFDGYGSTTHAVYQMWYASNSDPAVITAGTPGAAAATVDTDNGPEAATVTPDTTSNIFEVDTADPITSGGDTTVTDWADWTWDRPFATAAVPQTTGNP